jgi:DNA polymerase III subunit epsilon
MPVDIFRLFRAMPVRPVVFGLFGAAWAGSTLIWATSATTVWTMVALSALVMLPAWYCVDRLIVARLHDHRSLPARPEFFDFQARDQPMHWDELGGASLRDLRYVVFDTETTGLHPSDGDEIISIGALRIENGEIHEADAFSRLVNPGRDIPAASTRIHGITNDMVAGEDDIGRVLPPFRDFIGDAVLVAHNADFDMKFLQLKETQTGIEISNLVLDTLLISVFLDHDSQDHSLDSLAQRAGISIDGRHTALGDSLATGRLFLKMINRLEARGITTLRQLVKASAAIEHVRKSGGAF